ncbi:class I SAM-dependent methyltransferase [Sphingomonas sp. DT-207]|uniref:class I SAM-dependent methyltransferase n=1 Tax=Sphingomonas sp. DT-207 TaxID=3396167 RepID=UPI003F1BD792
MTGAAPQQTRSALFRYIENLQGDRPWGSFLDAGTGTHSARWLSSLVTQRWVAVTGATAHALQVRDAVEPVRRAQDRILVANWADPTLLAGERFDTVLADYLLGAVEGFAPRFQSTLFARLRLITGGRIYLVGLEPYVTHDPGTPAGRVIWEIGRFRDACLLLTGERPYREYPMQWVLEQMERAGFRVIASRRFPIRYKARFVNSQIDMCAPRLARLHDRGLAAALAAHGEQLRTAALEFAANEDGIRHGHDYVIAAEPC